MHENKLINYLVGLVDLKSLNGVLEENFKLTDEKVDDELVIPDDASLQEIRKLATEQHKRQNRRSLQQQNLIRKAIKIAQRWGL